MKAFITKYALTQGIFMIDAVRLGDNVIRERTTEGYQQYFHKSNKDWHSTMAEAIKQAELMRKKKVESLRKQLLKIELIDFRKIKF